MKELIEISECHGKPTVSARELHAFLESKQQFADWIKTRFDPRKFDPGVDFVLEYDQGAIVDYTISVDTAKELLWVYRSEKGDEARKYFIQIGL